MGNERRDRIDRTIGRLNRRFGRELLFVAKNGVETVFDAIKDFAATGGVRS